MESWNFYMPTRIRFGWGRLKEIRQVVDELGGKRIFLVTGKRSSRKHGILERIADLLKGLSLETFAEIEENPSVETVDKGAKRCQEVACDFLIALEEAAPSMPGRPLPCCRRTRVRSRNIWTRKESAPPKGYP